MKSSLIIILICFITIGYFITYTATLEVGVGYPYANFRDAAQDASSGDTILFHEGTYEGGEYVSDLQGEDNNFTYILTAPGETVITDGSSQAWHLPEAEYLFISGFTFQNQTGNGINVDDGGSYETPAHHITFTNCVFQDMQATGNCDLLKMSGVDNFLIDNCIFKNGSEGGSGIDMVGCHNGTIKNCYFENQGANAIQAKGGSQYITIQRNLFKDGGARSLNLGGSTGLEFFRSDTAHFEAADLKVYSNIFIRSYAPIAYVGCINVSVINNTLYKPDHWVIRILQETVDPNWFYECGDNTFRNNIIYLGNSIATECNVGPDTRPETFTFSNNLWYHYEDDSWTGPDLPVIDENSIIGSDPDFANPDNDDFAIPPESPAAEKGYSVTEPALDFLGNQFALQRSVGAIEANPITSIKLKNNQSSILKYTPLQDGIQIFLPYSLSNQERICIAVYNCKGLLVDKHTAPLNRSSKSFVVSTSHFPNGIYLVKVNLLKTEIIGKIFVL